MGAHPAYHQLYGRAAPKFVYLRRERQVHKLTRAQNLTVWQIPSEQSQALAQLAQRGMQLQITVQDGTLWVNDGVKDSVEITPIKLMGPDT